MPVIFAVERPESRMDGIGIELLFASDSLIYKRILLDKILNLLNMIIARQDAMKNAFSPTVNIEIHSYEVDEAEFEEGPR